MGRKLFALLIALIFGTFVSFLIYGQLNRYKTELTKVKKDLRRVVVVTRDLDAYSKLTREDMKTVSMPQSSLTAKDPVSQEEALGKSTAMPMAVGDILTRGKLLLQTDRMTMAFKLSPGKLAIAVPIDEVCAAGGHAHPGDNVDIIHVFRKGSRDPAVSRLLLSKVRLLALGTDEGGKTEGGGKQTKARKILPATALLEVTPREATIIAWAQNQGAFWLALRPTLDDEPSPILTYRGPEGSLPVQQVATGSEPQHAKKTTILHKKDSWSIEMITPGNVQQVQVPIH